MRNYVDGKMALVLTLIIGGKYINFEATVLSNFQCGGVQLIWRTIGQGSTALAVGAGGDCVSFFSPTPTFFHPLCGKRLEIY